MATNECVNSSPQLTVANYKKHYHAPCESVTEGFQSWYKGTGIARKDHPLNDEISFKGCGACHSEQVLVIAAQHSVHPMNGDVYWDYEVECLACGKFTQRAYAEN